MHFRFLNGKLKNFLFLDLGHVLREDGESLRQEQLRQHDHHHHLVRSRRSIRDRKLSCQQLCFKIKSAGSDASIVFQDIITGSDVSKWNELGFRTSVNQMRILDLLAKKPIQMLNTQDEFLWSALQIQMKNHFKIGQNIRTFT